MAALGKCSVLAYGQSSIALMNLAKKKDVTQGRSLMSYNGSFSKLGLKLRNMASPKTAQGLVPAKQRPIANFQQDILQDVFVDYTPNNEEIRKKCEEEHGLIKNEIERDLLKIGEEPIQFLSWVDEIERLGVAYHFENIIEDRLQQIYEKLKERVQSYNELDLYQTSLMFRLFRQHRYNISSNVFERFLNEQGNFQESLKDDVVSLLNLYEAGYVKAQGEEILEKALEFAKIHLKVIVDSQPNHPLASQIDRALRYPIQRGVTRLECRHYITFYEANPCHNTRLLRFAKLDYDLVQSLYKDELSEMTRWAKSFNFTKKFSFARIRPVQSHFIAMTMLYEPKFSMTRKIFTKVTIIGTILDDIYDAFGTIEELEVLTEFIERWDRDRIDVRLPSYFKEFFEILYDVIKECEDDLAAIGRRNYVDLLISEIINTSKAYLQEAYWREAKYVPPYEEFIENGIKTASPLAVILALFINNVEENIVTKTIDIVCNNEHPQRAASTIARCLNDIAGFEFDKQREHVVGAVDCYMNQYGVSKEEAFAAMQDVIEREWKVLDEEMLKPTTDIPMLLLSRILNYTRICNYIYKYENGFTLASQRMKADFSLLYIQPTC